MRVVYLFVLVFLIAAIGIFAFENREQMTVQYFDRSVTCARSLMIAIVYLLGMVSGSVVVGLVWRTLRRATQTQLR